MKKSKVTKFIARILIFALVFTTIPSAYISAAESSNGVEVILSQEEQKAEMIENDPDVIFEDELIDAPRPDIVVDGEFISSDLSNAIVRNNKTYVTARFVAAVLGCTVDWERGNPGHWWATGSGKVIEGYAGNSYVAVNGRLVILDSPLFVIAIWEGDGYGHRNYLPLRFLSEQLGYGVDWYKDTVVITSPGEDSQKGKEAVDESNPFYNARYEEDSLRIHINGDEVPIEIIGTYFMEDIDTGESVYLLPEEEEFVIIEIDLGFTYGENNENVGSIATKVNIRRASYETADGFTTNISIDPNTSMPVWEGTLVTKIPGSNLNLHEAEQKVLVDMNVEVICAALGEMGDKLKIGPSKLINAAKIMDTAFKGVTGVFGRLDSLGDYANALAALQNSKNIADPELKSEYENLLFAKYIVGMLSPVIVHACGTGVASTVGVGTAGIGTIPAYALGAGIGISFVSAVNNYLNTNIARVETIIALEQQ